MIVSLNIYIFYPPSHKNGMNNLKITIYNSLILIQDVIDGWIFNNCNAFFIHLVTNTSLIFNFYNTTITYYQVTIIL